MKNIVKMALLTATTIFAVGATTFATIPAYAADCKVTGGLKSADSCAKGVQEENGGPTSLFDGDSPIFTTAINIMLFIIGILCLVFSQIASSMLSTIGMKTSSNDIKKA